MIDRTLKHYRIIGALGAGGMGDVYLAEDTTLERKVALKLLPADVASNRDRLERFVRMLYGEEYRFGFNAAPDPLGRALQAARRATAAAPSSHYAHLAMAQALFFRKEFDAFRNAAERAIALNPMDGASIEYLGHLLAFAGDWERGCELAGGRCRRMISQSRSLHTNLRSRLRRCGVQRTLSLDLCLGAFQQGKHAVKVFDSRPPAVEDCPPMIRFVSTGLSRAFRRRHVCRPAGIGPGAEQDGHDAPVAGTGGLPERSSATVYVLETRSGLQQRFRYRGVLVRRSHQWSASGNPPLGPFVRVGAGFHQQVHHRARACRHEGW
jgi:hypothetical protein